MQRAKSREPCLVTALRPATLAVLAVVAVATGWTGMRVWSTVDGGLPYVPRAAPFALLFLAAVLAGSALMMRRRVQARRPGTPLVSPHLAVRLLVLAQASAIVGSLVTGAYVGAALFYAEDLDVPFRRAAAAWCLGSAFAGLVVVISAVWLERECRVPPDQDPEGEPLGA